MSLRAADHSLRGPSLEPAAHLAANHALLYFQAAIDRDLQMYNVNPDITVNNPQGGLWYMPGLLAKRYEAMGGRVTYFGKPHKVVALFFGHDPTSAKIVFRRNHEIRRVCGLDASLLPPLSPAVFFALSIAVNLHFFSSGSLRDRRGEDGPGQGQGGACAFRAFFMTYILSGVRGLQRT